MKTLEVELAVNEAMSDEATLAALARMERAFLALAASWYEIRGMAAQDAGDERDERTVVLDDLAAEFARCARKCRKARLVVGNQEDLAASPLVAL
jgi:hypothetical protein